MHTVLILFKLFDTEMINLFRGIIISISRACHLLKRQVCVFSDFKYYRIDCLLFSSRFLLQYISATKNKLSVFLLIILCALLEEEIRCIASSFPGIPSCIGNPRILF